MLLDYKRIKLFVSTGSPRKFPKMAISQSYIPKIKDKKTTYEEDQGLR